MGETNLKLTELADENWTKELFVGMEMRGIKSKNADLVGVGENLRMEYEGKWSMGKR